MGVRGAANGGLSRVHQIIFQGPGRYKKNFRPYPLAGVGVGTQNHIDGPRKSLNFRAPGTSGLQAATLGLQNPDFHISKASLNFSKPWRKARVCVV